MSTDAKSNASSSSSTPRKRDKGVKIFMWPKLIYIYPSAIVSLICALGMYWLPHKTYDPSKPEANVVTTVPATVETKTGTPPADTQVEVKPAAGETVVVEESGAHAATKRERFNTPQNLFGVLFLGVLAFNMVVMGLDFPRFELIGLVLAILFATFFVLWLGSYFDLDLLRPLDQALANIYVFANAGFYLMYSLVIFAVLGVVYITRWLDYWEILPNEILHHHGPMSDLERFPTLNLKFDKEIPDVLEFLMLGAGRLVLHVPNVEKALVMDNVLFINSKEEALKRLMSRLDVRITNDGVDANVS